MITLPCPIFVPPIFNPSVSKLKLPPPDPSPPPEYPPPEPFLPPLSSEAPPPPKPPSKLVSLTPPIAPFKKDRPFSLPPLPSVSSPPPAPFSQFVAPPLPFVPPFPPPDVCDLPFAPSPPAPPAITIGELSSRVTKVPPEPPRCRPICPIKIFKVSLPLKSKVPRTSAPNPPKLPPAPATSIMYFPAAGTSQSWMPWWTPMFTFPSKLVPW